MPARRASGFLLLTILTLAVGVGGFEPDHVLTLGVIVDVLGQGLRLAGPGIVIGIGLALAATRLLNNLLFGTSPTDALTFAVVATLLLAITIASSMVPALRASRVDPLMALRDE